jgi:hypothetical protein
MPKEEAGAKPANADHSLPASRHQSAADGPGLQRTVLAEADSRHSGSDASALCVAGPHGVLVDSKELVMKVFLDTEENYTVSGYAARSRECFRGEIFLALDKGEEYSRQSTKVNAAIHAVPEREAFALALDETRKVLAANPGATIQVVSVKALAGLCIHWFDLPDTVHVVEGGLRFAVEAPPRCPGDYTLPSGYMFHPDPEPGLPDLGPGFGLLLTDAITQFVAGFRASSTLPKGVLARAVFEAFSPEEDALITRTIIGVMMGMLPTIDGNLTRTVKAWREGSRFAELQEALKKHGGSDAYTRANEVLRRPLMQAMQQDPVPDKVWRLAAKDHTLGTKNPIQVHRGDKIYVCIVAATHEDAAAGITDVFPVFGGDRSAQPHPTHACPAYAMAMGILLGIINGYMEPA